MGKSAFTLLVLALAFLVFLLILPYSLALISLIFVLLGFPMETALVTGGILYIVLLSLDIYVLSGFKIIREWERVPVLRLGKYIGLLGPGFIHIWRGFESYVMTVDLRTTGISVDQRKH